MSIDEQNKRGALQRSARSLDLCAQVHEDDGVPMRERERGSREYARSRKRNHHKKRAQLCAQIERTAIEALLAEFEDPLLLGLTVVGVEPAPDTDHLRVLVKPSSIESELDVPEVERRLERIAPRLRALIAQDISRKRTPFISFGIILDG